MLFNSIEFAIFLPIVFLLYWFVFKYNTRVQNAFLLVSSYYFYGSWDWRFLILLIGSSGIDYFVGLAIWKQENANNRKLLLALGIILNLVILGFFKYFNFFSLQFHRVFTLFGGSFDLTTLKIILPVGISFYTFQSMSYSIDIYRKKLEPTKDFIAYQAFVCFFPQLVAGPIERAKNLLPQFSQKRVFSYPEAVDGMRQILWGMYKKMVVADTCAEYVKYCYANPNLYDGSELLVASIFFAFQIYGDFSGYSDIAIGTSKLLGFNLMRNFAFPYFSRDIAEFWRRWHISLSTWFRDYVYIPIGGNRGNKLFQIRNTFIVFAVSGFWHGASWTFVVWGLINAVYFLPLLLSNKNRDHLDIVAIGRILPNSKEFIQILFTFLLTVLAWVLFRAGTFNDALVIYKKIFSLSLFNIPKGNFIEPVSFILFLIVVEWAQRTKQHALDLNGVFERLLKHINLNRQYFNIEIISRWFVYLVIVSLIFLFGKTQNEFIYFQF
ncbi:MAG: acyltransferase [Bacteroidetes bacterium GWE2_29_8]|nr:MAG: acyltransferase [Bacteroidetes bacterium GWE2_29_8]OFY22061.1 MAG: acyltransferase [Bacteroidetes bacterium GWF2_29_10]